MLLLASTDFAHHFNIADGRQFSIIGSLLLNVISPPNSCYVDLTALSLEL